MIPVFFLATLVGVGLVSAGVTAPILDTYHRYKEVYIFAFIIAVVSFLWFALVATFQPTPEAMLIPPLVLLGVAAFIILPTALELSVELSYPVSPATSAGFLWMAGQVVGIISLFVCNALLDQTDQTDQIHHNNKATGSLNSIWFLFALVLFGALLTFVYIPLNPQYKRLEHERNRARDGPNPAANLNQFE